MWKIASGRQDPSQLNFFTCQRGWESVETGILKHFRVWCSMIVEYEGQDSVSWSVLTCLNCPLLSAKCSKVPFLVPDQTSRHLKMRGVGGGLRDTTCCLLALLFSFFPSSFIGEGYFRSYASLLSVMYVFIWFIFKNTFWQCHYVMIL